MKLDKKLIPHLVVIAIFYYLFPNLIKNKDFLVLQIILYNPLVVFISGLIYSVNSGFNLLFSIMAAILFIPAVFIMYNESALFYIPFYGVVALISNVVGFVLNKK